MTSPDTFTGAGHLLLAGIPAMRHQGLTGTRVTPPVQAADTPGQAPLLRAILSEVTSGHFNRPHDTGENSKVALPHDLQSLGAITAITWLGMADTNRDRAMLPDFFTVYLVDFRNVRRFCGLHITKAGFLDGLRCV